MAAAKSVSVFAPAKVNLTLHITGQRADGYHLLDSLVAFADVGDQLIVQTADQASMTIDGPEATSVPQDMDNLVSRVAALFDDMPGTSFVLTKNLPVSSGIGGGSADAAAAFRGLVALGAGTDTGTAVFDAMQSPTAAGLLALGADIPMCLLSAIARVQGIGETITPLDSLPGLHAVLVNPRRGVSTPSVFSALDCRENAAMPDDAFGLSDAGAFIEWLAMQRNDLEDAAIRLEPSIAEVKQALILDSRCRLARMSGSGATCFGLFDTSADAQSAAEQLSQDHPNWWVKAAQLGTQTARARPHFR